MKLLVIILGFLNGGYMLLDGIYVIVKGKYIGPPRPGPWSILFEKLRIDVFSLGPLFVVFGLAWILWTIAVVNHQGWAYAMGIFLSILTLWYLPVGTLFSIVILFVLFFARNRML